MPPEPTAADRCERECRALVRYLSGHEATPYEIDCYRRSQASLQDPGRLPAIDRLLLSAAVLGPWAARAADGYARIARPVGPLRRRLTLAAAILETSPESHRWFNTSAVGSPVRVLGGLAGALFGSGISMLAGAVIFGPLHLLTSTLSSVARRPAVTP